MPVSKLHLKLRAALLAAYRLNDFLKAKLSPRLLLDLPPGFFLDDSCPPKSGKVYRAGLTRRQLRAARSLSGLTNPKKCAEWWENMKKIEPSLVKPTRTGG